MCFKMRLYELRIYDGTIERELGHYGSLLIGLRSHCFCLSYKEIKLNHPLCTEKFEL